MSAVLKHEARHRISFLAQACGGDEELRKEVEELLSAHQAAGNFLEEPPTNATETLRDGQRALSANETGGTHSQSGRTLASSGEDGALERGSVLGRYIVLNKLGSGGMGVVYAA
jgi:hypothetical protein